MQIGIFRLSGVPVINHIIVIYILPLDPRACLKIPTSRHINPLPNPAHIGRTIIWRTGGAFVVIDELL
jgi:hypothetical protein